MSALFEPFQRKDITLRNRIAVPPMCQYRAVERLVNAGCHVHLAHVESRIHKLENPHDPVNDPGNRW